MKISYKSLFAVLIVLALAVFSGCGRKEPTEEPVAEPSEEAIEETTDLPSTEEPVAEPSEEATEETTDLPSTEDPAEPPVNETTPIDEMISASDEAFQKDSTEPCEKLSDDSLKQECKDNYYFTKALDAKDTSYCDNVSTEKRKANCVESATAVTTSPDEDVAEVATEESVPAETPVE